MRNTLGFFALVVAVAVTMGLVTSPQASAVPLYWWAASGAQGGTGTWDCGTTTNWNTTTSGSANSVWTPNDGSVDAIFGGTTGTITLGDCATANMLVFQVDADCIGKTGTRVLSLAGAANLVANSGMTANIWRPITGSAGLNKIASGSTAYGGNSGTVLLGAVCTYSGNTVIDCGTLSLGIANALPSTTNLTVNTGGTVSAGGANQLVNGVILQGGTITNTGNYILFSSNTTFDLRSGTARTLGGSAGVGIRKTTNGTVTLNGVYGTFPGQTVISDGTIVDAGYDVLGTGGVFGLNTLPVMLGDCSTTDVHGNPTLQLPTASNTINHPITVSDCATSGVYTIGVASGAVGAIGSFAGLITVNQNLTVNDTYGFIISGGITGGNLPLGPATKTVTFIGNGSTTGGTTIQTNPISDGSSKVAVVINQSGSGQTQFNIANTYTGSTTIQTGKLILGTNYALPSGTSVTCSGGTLAMGTYTDCVTSFSLAGGTVTGTGTLVITGGKLSGTGSLPVAVLIAGGNLSPGFSPGSLTLANRAAFTSSADNYIVDINGIGARNYDNVLFKVSMNLNNASLVINDLTYKAGTPTLNDKFYVMDSDNSNAGAAVVGTFNGGATTVYGASGIGYTVSYNVSGDPKNTLHDVLLTTYSLPAAPEPATLFLMGTGALGALGWMRRRRAK